MRLVRVPTLLMHLSAVVQLGFLPQNLNWHMVRWYGFVPYRYPLVTEAWLPVPTVGTVPLPTVYLPPYRTYHLHNGGTYYHKKTLFRLFLGSWL